MTLNHMLAHMATLLAQESITMLIAAETIKVMAIQHVKIALHVQVSIKDIIMEHVMGFMSIATVKVNIIMIKLHAQEITRIVLINNGK